MEFKFPFWSKAKVEDNTESDVVTSNSLTVNDDDGSFKIDGGSFGYNVAFDWFGDNQDELILTYRTIALQPEVDYAIEDIVNEAIASEDDESPIEIDLSHVENLSDAVKEKIRDEYEYIMDLLNFNQTAHYHFRNWYIDGRSFYHKIIDKQNLKKGLIGVQKIDSAKMKPIEEIQRNEDGTIKSVKDYFVFDDTKGETGNKTKQSKGQNPSTQIFKLPKESITYITSGLVDPKSKFVLSHLHKAIKPANQLRMMEDSSVVYRLARAPERRVFYVDVGSLRGTKAETYMRSLMQSQRSKVSYDLEDGKISNSKDHMTMLEDIWLPRREGGKGTEVSTLPGGNNLGEMDDVEFFLRKLYKSLNVPMSRLDSDSAVQFGRSAEITRDELKFNKFIGRLRKRFNHLFLDLLKTQVTLKKIMTAKEWDRIEHQIRFDYSHDFHINEMKEFELLQARAEVAEQIEKYVGKYISHDYMRRHIFKQTDDEIALEDKQIEKEKTDPKYEVPEEDESF